ncbi:hypothetical protein NEFER03_0348 [Nematocida sp. LUAm3]|nr:hypothetical protein NEFER03_0348 [Nematocida sp. LUAm3]KAI5175964.1 hypothetical protein NEFER02_1810 [Nematocida sp. LUAm2]KAI5179060.1 hypothetical protein NEFER01_1927 [Nematocida sp. LUAm1]
MYYALYTHKNSLIYENHEEEGCRVLGYSSTDVIDEVVKRTESKVFYDLVRYNGRSVSGVLLENGYKVIFLGEFSHHEIASIAQEMRQYILRNT